MRRISVISVGFLSMGFVLAGCGDGNEIRPGVQVDCESSQLLIASCGNAFACVSLPDACDAEATCDCVISNYSCDDSCDGLAGSAELSIQDGSAVCTEDGDGVVTIDVPPIDGC